MTEGGLLGGAVVHLTGGMGLGVRSLLGFAQEHPKIPKSWGSTQQGGHRGQPQGERQRRGVGRLEKAAA